MTLFTLFAVIGIILFLYMTGWFLIALVWKRNDVVDLAWGLGFILVAIVSLMLAEVWTLNKILITILITIWGLRLTLHIYSRNRGKSEDFRYKKWREEWGKWFTLRSYLQVFMLQGVLLFVIALPIMIIATYDPHAFHWTTIVGLVIWLVGFSFETIGDHQLTQFIKNPENAGKIMKTGLWRYTRHPNYFGEVTLWWGILVIGACSIGVGPFGWLAVAGPITITYLILLVSGVPMLEKSWKGNRAYQAYKRKTSIFFPLPPKKLGKKKR